MSEIRLIKPDSSIIGFYKEIWEGNMLKSYSTRLLYYGEIDSIITFITIDDVRPLVYKQHPDESGFFNTAFKDADDFINEAVKKAREDGDFSDVVTRINAKYHTHTPRSVVDTLNSNWNDILFKITEVKSEKDNVKSRNKRNTIIDIIADGNGNPNRYSFATKFCSFIEPDLFPIFDSFSSTMLYAYLKEAGYNIDKDNLGLYFYYLEAYDVFKEEFNLQEETYKKIDEFLWLYGTAISRIAQKKCLYKPSSPKYISRVEARNTVVEEIIKNTLED